MYHHPSCEECREGRRSIDVNHTSQLESFICSGSGSVSGFQISWFSIRPKIHPWASHNIRLQCILGIYVRHQLASQTFCFFQHDTVLVPWWLFLSIQWFSTVDQNVLNTISLCSTDKAYQVQLADLQ